MTALFSGQGGYTDTVGPKRPAALKQGSVGEVKSDLQNMQDNERKQHEQNYIYAHGHNDGSAPLGKGSF